MENLFCLKSEIFKIVIDIDITSDILKNNFNVFQHVNNNRTLLKKMSEMKGQIRDNIEVKKEYENIEYKYNENKLNITMNSFLYLSLIAWVEYEKSTDKLDEIKASNFVKSKSDLFKNLSSVDLIELYFNIQSNGFLSNITDKWRYKEIKKNNKVTSLMNAKNIIIILLCKKRIFDIDKLRMLQMLNKEYIYFFEDIKRKVDGLNLFINKDSIYFENSLFTKSIIIKELDEIIKICKNDKDEYLKNLILEENDVENFKQEIKELLEDKTKSSFLEMYKAVRFLDEEVNYNNEGVYSFEKDSYYNNKNIDIKDIALDSFQCLKEVKEEFILKKINSISQEIEIDLDLILEKFD